MKTILLTSSVTASAMALIFALFLSPILGRFGLVATSVETMQGLTAASRVVEKMRLRQAAKKARIKNRFAKRASRRVSSLALAASTIGTAAVVVTMVGLEVADYCEEKRELMVDEGILNGSAVSFDFEQCLEEGKAEAEGLVEELEESSLQAASSAIDATSEYGRMKWSALKRAYAEAIESATSASYDMWDAIQAWVVGH